MIYVDGHGATIQRIDPPAGVVSWVRKIHAPAWWRLGRRGSGIKVAVIDTGVDQLHPYLAGRIVASRSFVPGQDAGDRHGHGTHVAGIIAQVAPGTEIINAQGLSDSGSGREEWLAEAVRWCVAQGARIINASWSSQEPMDTPAGQDLHRAIQEAVAAGVVFVAAAGNEGHRLLEINTVGWPARWQEPLAVAATMQLYAGAEKAGPAFYSSAGPEIDVAAPGTDIESCAPGGGWVRLSGTSMAAPVVSGCLALLAEDYEIREGAPAPEPVLVALVQFLTRDIPPVGRDVLAGVGEIDLEPRVETRRISLTRGEARVEVQEGNTLRRGTHTITVPAEIRPPGRFVVEFRGGFEAAGAREIIWDPATETGTAVMDVLVSEEEVGVR